jgi:Cd2+/Zn2+-exporting ATPase
VSFAAIVATIPPLVLGEPFDKWIYRALIFLVISCPCALLISVPLSFFAGIGAAARNGIFVKGGEYLEALAHVTTMVFDKTGTLTTGDFTVQELIVEEGYTREEALRYAAIAEKHSTHPIGRCLVRAYGKEISAEYTDYQELAGQGVSAVVDGDTIQVGKVANLDNRYTYVRVNGKLAARALIGDMVSANANDSLFALKALGVKRLFMLSGDNELAAKYVADSLPLDGYKAELMPADKLEHLVKLLGEGGKVAFVGDGVNDAPSLARADVGIAMGGAGADAAMEAADIVLMEDDLSKVPLAIKIAHKTRRVAYQNIVGAIGVKVIVMFLGTMGYAALWMAIFADVGVALLAVLNAMRVLRVR